MDQKSVPDWLPSRPLLLGYLAVKGGLDSPNSGLMHMLRSEGWNYLLDKICEREGKQIEDLGGDSRGVRTYIERLATRARASSSGRGPILPSELDRIFRQVFPSTPDETAQQLLVRMAGLTASSSNNGVIPSAPDQQDAREFLDEDFVNAAMAGDVARFIEDPYNEDLVELFCDANCIWRMTDLGLEVTGHILNPNLIAKIPYALRRAANEISAPALALDLLELMKMHSKSVGKDLSKSNLITISNAYITHFEFSPGADFSGVELKECIFDKISVFRQDGSILGPRMVECIVGQAIGVVSRQDIPSSIIDDATTIESYQMGSDVPAEMSRLALPVGVRVLLVSLRKLFVQQGRARKENAFPRGLDDSERPYVPDILALLQKHNFAHPQRMGGPPLWISNRAMTKEALTILHAPQECSHEILREARDL